MKSHRNVGLFGFATALLAYLATACPAAITYQMSPWDAFDGGWTFDGGSITTDGTIGEVDPTQFISWTLRFTSPFGTTVIDKTNSNAILLSESLFPPSTFSTTTVAASLVASQRALTAYPGETSFLSLYFATQDIFSDDFTGNGIAFWPRFSDVLLVDGISGMIIDNRIDQSIPYRPFRLMEPNMFPGPRSNPNASRYARPAGPLTLGSVASVPEPTTSVFICLAVAGSVAIHRRKTA